MTSATNFTVANKLSLIFSYFSTEDSFTPMNVKSDFIFSLFLALIASEKFENIFGESNDFNLIKSPFAKEVSIVSYAISAPLRNSFLSFPLIFLNFVFVAQLLF